MDKTKSFIDPHLIAPHFSTSIYKGYLAYLEKKFGEVKSREIVAKTGITWDYLTKESNWVSEAFAETFYDVLTQEPGIDLDFSYQAGKLSMARESQGTVHLLAMQLLDPKELFKQIVYFSSRFNQVDQLEIIELGRNELTLRYGCHRESKYVAQIMDNWRGFLEYTPALLGLPLGKCVAAQTDPKTVVFSLRWMSNRAYLTLKRMQIGLGIAVVLASLTTLSKLGWPPLPFVNTGIAFATTAVLLGFALACTLWIEKMRHQFDGSSADHLKRLLTETEERYNELVENKSRLDRRYREAHLLAGVFNRISSTQEPSELVQKTVTEIQESLKYDRVVYMSFDPERNCIHTTASIGFDRAQTEIVGRYAIDLREQTASGFHLGNVFKERKSILIPVTSDYYNTLSEQGRTMLVFLKSKSFLACSVATEANPYGVLLVDYMQSDKALDQDDLYFIQNIANQLAICIENTRTLSTERRLRAAFQQFVPIEVVKSMMGESKVDLREGVSQELTALFSDIRQFTKLSSSVEPALLIKAINYYFKVMTDIVYKHGGIVDKFMGDGLLAYFNAFGDRPEHSLDAVQAAYEMQQAMPEVNRWIRHHLFPNDPWQPLEIGVGLHTGHAIVGYVGAGNKMEFTGVGETINVTARIAEISKKHKGSIVISEELLQKVEPAFELECIGNFEIRGLDREKTVYLVSQPRGAATVTSIVDKSNVVALPVRNAA